MERPNDGALRTDLDGATRRILETGGTAFLLGGIDTGKTSFALQLLAQATAAGKRCALVDANIDQSTVGPPTTLGIKFLEPHSEVTIDSVRTADGMAFVGSLVPREHLLPIVVGARKLVRQARDNGADLIVIDTPSFVAGIYGQSLNYYLMDASAPDAVLAFERGGELEPLVGIAQRFTSAQVIEAEITDRPSRSAEEKMTFREQQFAAYFKETSRWRVRPTVFMPTLPPEFDHHLLDGLVVGMEDGHGSCVGIGVLEHDTAEDILRMVSPVTEGVRGLRLGSVRIDPGGRARGPVSLRDLFGTE